MQNGGMTYRRTLLALCCLAVAVAVTATAQKKYTGPRPAKPDVPFLLIIDKLIEVESAMAQESSAKNSTTYTVSGESSNVRSPVPEPVFLFQAEKLNPERLSLFRMNPAGGKRSLTIPTGKKPKNAPVPVYFLTTPLDGGLFRIEVNEYIPPGEYCFSPDGSNQVFCFTTY